MDMSLGKLQEIVKDKEAWHATAHRITESDTTFTKNMDLEKYKLQD